MEYRYLTWQNINITPTSDDNSFTLRWRDFYDETTDLCNLHIIDNNQQLKELNNITSQYVAPTAEAPTTSKFFLDQGQTAIFEVVDSSNEISDTLTVEYDWSYEEPKEFETISRSRPITKVLDYRQMFVHSLKINGEDTIELTSNGNVLRSYDTYDFDNRYFTYHIFQKLSELEYNGEFNYDFSDDFLVMKKIPAGLDVNTISILGVDYAVMHTCKKYALYYINELGGYDTLLIDGKATQTDNFTRNSYKNPKTNIFKTTIKESWNLKTHWMTDEQSLKMHTIFSSNHLWLMDLEEQTFVEVNIKDSSAQRKTYANQSGLCSYEINVEAASEKIRLN